MHAIGTTLVASMIRQRTLTLWCQNSRNGTLILDGSMIRVLIIDPTVLIFWVLAGCRAPKFCMPDWLCMLRMVTEGRVCQLQFCGRLEQPFQFAFVIV